MTIDDLLPDPWDPGILASLQQWRQGHLIRLDTGVWLAPAWADDPVTATSTAGADGELQTRSAPLSDTGYLAVVSQTCDISGAPAQRHPLVHACPVIDVNHFPPDKIQQIIDHRVTDFVLLTKPPVPQAHWGIDLRVMIPISKHLLAGSEPVDGFATAEDELILGQRLASKLSRPALHDTLAGPIVGALRALIAREKKKGLWCDAVEQLRLEIVDGTAMAPRRVRLLVITDRKMEPAEVKSLREEWMSHRKLMQANGIKWAPLDVRTVDECPVRLYRSAIPIEVPALDRGRFS